MTPGDLVIYTADPLLFGRMIILSVDQGRYQCEAIHADPDGNHPRETFAAHELEVYTRAQTTA